MYRRPISLGGCEVVRKSNRWSLVVTLDSDPANDIEEIVGDVRDVLEDGALEAVGLRVVSIVPSPTSPISTR